MISAAAVTATGCFGSFGAFHALWGWNNDFDSKWVKWLVFLGLNIIPIYGLFFLADVLVLNSLEFWTGSNPVKSGSNGRTVVRVATRDPRTVRIEVRAGERVEQEFLCRRVSEDHLQICSATGDLMAEVIGEPQGGVTLRGAEGQVLARLDGEQVARAEGQIRRGAPAHSALVSELGTQAKPLAALRDQTRADAS